MKKALEKDLFIHVDEISKRRITNVFRLAKTIQLPVIEEGAIVGILDLFAFLETKGKQFQIRDIMETNFTVAGVSPGVFLFNDSKQLILPFVDAEGNYIGFVNRFFQKCYLPSQEYMQVMEEYIDRVSGANLQIDIDTAKHTFDFILESNFDGIYITVDKGKTLSINRNCEYVKGISSDNLNISAENIDLEYDTDNTMDAAVVQMIQQRNEVSVSDDILTDGGIVRIINNINLIKQELKKARELTEKYKNELQFLRWEQSKTGDIVASSHGMKKIVNLAIRIAKVDSTVLLQGQSGVGKGVISKLIHNNSPRKDKPFIKIDCGAIPEQLLESELFGYEQGAFTGAQKGGKIGLVELANRGTLFLDEIGELPLNLQIKLLRVIQDKEILRIGANSTIPVDIRIIAATNRDLSDMVDKGTFRNDLYYRLNVVPLKIPPLCERKEDIKPLIQNCLNRFNQKYGFEMQIDGEALKALIDYSWPGNVRELENIVEYLVVTSNPDVITKDIVPDNIRKNNGDSKIELKNAASMKEAVRLVEIDLLLQAMEKSRSAEEMAKLLKLDRTTIIRKMQKYNIRMRFE